MNQQEYPRGWDLERAKRLAEYYDNLSEEDQVAEDEAAAHNREGQVVIAVREDSLPAIRQLLAGHAGT